MAKTAHVFARSHEKLSSIKNSPSENRYRKTRDVELAELEDELNKKEEEVVNEEEEVVTPSNTNNNYEKRYRDLQSYAARKENEFKSEIEALKKQVAELNNKPTQFPKTEEEVQEWVERYPDVAAIIETIAGKTSEKTKQEIKQDMETIRIEKERITFQRAYAQLLALHPDFDELRTKEIFTNWMNEQPPVLQKAIYEPTLDEAGVKAAARVIDLFKKETGTKTKSSPVDAASRVSKSVSNAPDSTGDKKRFSESQIAEMTDREYEKLEEEIYKAQKEGRFDYDLSGGAR